MKMQLIDILLIKKEIQREFNENNDKNITKVCLMLYTTEK